MTDLPDLPSAAWTGERAKWQVARGIMVASWWMTLAVVMTLVLAPVYQHLFTDKQPNDAMIAMAGVALLMLKDFALAIREFIAEATK